MSQKILYLTMLDHLSLSLNLQKRIAMGTTSPHHPLLCIQPGPHCSLGDITFSFTSCKFYHHFPFRLLTQGFLDPHRQISKNLTMTCLILKFTKEVMSISHLPMDTRLSWFSVILIFLCCLDSLYGIH